MRKIPLWLRWLGIIVGALFLLWLPIEEASLWPANLLAAVASAWLALFFMYRRGLTTRRTYHYWIGMTAGLLVIPFSFLLIFFKSALHAHGFMEFPISLLLKNAQNTPWLIFFGILIPVIYYRLIDSYK